MPTLAGAFRPPQKPKSNLARYVGLMQKMSHWKKATSEKEHDHGESKAGVEADKAEAHTKPA